MEDAIYFNWACGSTETVCHQLEQALGKVAILSRTSLEPQQRQLPRPLQPGAGGRVVEVSPPALVEEALKADGSHATVLPCRISVYEEAGKVWVALPRPTVVRASLGRTPALPAVAQLEQTLLGVIESVCGWSRRSQTLGTWNMC